MINTRDKNLEELAPSISWDDFKDDLEDIINEKGFHSDEVSETDTERTGSERRLKIRPDYKKKDDYHVIHVYDKPWRSRRVSNYYYNCNLLNFNNILIHNNQVKKILRLADEMGEKISHVKCSRKRWYCDAKWADRSKPPLDAPVWSISTSYISDEEGNDEEEVESNAASRSSNSSVIGNRSGGGNGNRRGGSNGGGSGNGGGNGNGSGGNVIGNGGGNESENGSGDSGENGSGGGSENGSGKKQNDGATTSDNEDLDDN